MFVSEDDYDHAAWCAAQDRWEADYKRRVARLSELDAAIARAERATQHYEARIARSDGRIAWFRKFAHIARRAAARRFTAAASRTLAANRRMARTRPFHRGEVAPARRMALASRAAGDDPAAVPIVATVVGKAVLA